MSKRNILFKISYVGTNYHGFASQKNSVTVSDVIKRSLESILHEDIYIYGCSRTDSKVHANEYYFNIYTDTTINCDKLIKATNSFLPNDIVVLDCKDMDMDFHARFSAKYKQYIYKIWNSNIRNPFLENLAYHYPYKINIDIIKDASKYFVGEHDFKAFSNKGNKIENTVRKINDIYIEKSGELLTISLTGNGFLYNMVRIIVGTILKVNKGDILPCDIKKIIESKDRKNAGKTAPAKGLYLNKVFY